MVTFFAPFFSEGIGAEERKLYWTLKDMMTTNWDSGKMTSLRYVVKQQQNFSISYIR